MRGAPRPSFCGASVATRRLSLSTARELPSRVPSDAAVCRSPIVTYVVRPYPRGTPLSTRVAPARHVASGAPLRDAPLRRPSAARRGVTVSIIVPQKVDSMMVRFASRSYFGELLSAGVKIFEYEDGLLHSKTILIDGSVCYLGTVNLDMRSFYLNLEITLALHSHSDCAEILKILEGYIASSQEVQADDWGYGKRSKPAMFAENLVRLASPLL